jgi:hypothetical protein
MPTFTFCNTRAIPFIGCEYLGTRGMPSSEFLPGDTGGGSCASLEICLLVPLLLSSNLHTFGLTQDASLGQGVCKAQEACLVSGSLMLILDIFSLHLQTQITLNHICSGRGSEKMPDGKSFFRPSALITPLRGGVILPTTLYLTPKYPTARLLTPARCVWL